MVYLSSATESAAVVVESGEVGGGDEGGVSIHVSPPADTKVKGPGKPKGSPAATAVVTAMLPPTPFVLIDVEGTQSRDRGPNGEEFDSR